MQAVCLQLHIAATNGFSGRCPAAGAPGQPERQGPRWLGALHAAAYWGQVSARGPGLMSPQVTQTSAAPCSGPQVRLVELLVAG